MFEDKEAVKENEISVREKRVRSMVHLYYSRKDVQKAIYDFSRHREICPRYFEGFGKRPDTLEYPSDIMAFVKKGATSFHCSEELWEDPLKIETGMTEQQANNLRKGWDLLIDIDSKYIDYSKIAAGVIIEMLEFHGVKNIGVKFSGNKGFHILIPWKAFPKEVNEVQTSNNFPEYARIITQYITAKIKKRLIEKISELSKPNKYVKDFQAPKEVMPDIILVSPRHLFRAPYSLHEKTALASVVLDKNKIENFELKDADPMKVLVENFYPNAKESEAKELLVQALDWWKDKNKGERKKSTGVFEPIKIGKLSDKNFPPCVLEILKGVSDGRKRSVFVLINLFRSVGMERDEMEKRIYDWNKKNKVPLKEGYIKSQLSWSYGKKPVLPPNCREFYSGIGVCVPDNFCKKIKNPVNYIVRKSMMGERREKFWKKVGKGE